MYELPATHVGFLKVCLFQLSLMRTIEMCQMRKRRKVCVYENERLFHFHEPAKVVPLVCSIL